MPFLRFGTLPYPGYFGYMLNKAKQIDNEMSSTTWKDPEEMIAAAHASCFSMALSGALSAAGHVPTSVATTATVDLNKVGAGFAITGIHLATVVAAPGLTAEQLATISNDAKSNCPVSRALAAVPITLTATLG